MTTFDLLDLWRLTDDRLRELSPTLALYMPELSPAEKKARRALHAEVDRLRPRRLVVAANVPVLILAPQGLLKTEAVVRARPRSREGGFLGLFSNASDVRDVWVDADLDLFVRIEQYAGHVRWNFLAKRWDSVPVDGPRRHGFVTAAEAALDVASRAR